MLPEPTGIGPQIFNPTSLSLSPEEVGILKTMFASYQRVTIKEEFGGGLSSSRVLLVRPVESEHSPELPAVVKIAPAGLIRKEAQAYRDYVYQKLPGIAEITGEPVFLPDGSWGGLRYTLMGEGGTFEIESLHSYCRHASTADILYVLRDRLFRIVGPNWWQMVHTNPDWPVQASYDFLLPVNLLIEPAAPPPDVSPPTLKPNAFPDQPLRRDDYVRLEGFVISEVDPQQKTVTLNVPSREDGLPASYRLRLQSVEPIEIYRVGDEIASIAGRVTETRYDQLQGIAQDVLEHLFDLTTDTLTSPYGTVLPNPLTALPALLGKTRNVRVSCIHGDLNVENILVEPAGRNVSLIDFATARRDHALHDLLRLETEVVTKLLPETLVGANLLVETIGAFYKRLHKATFAHAQPVSAQPLQAGLDKPFQMLVVIREMARQCLFDANDWTEYYEGLTLYLLGASKFKNLDRLSKQVAFWTAAIAYNFVEPVAKAMPTSKDWSRLQRYLPAEMYQGQDEAVCLDHLNVLLRAVLTYVPRHVALDLLQRPVVAENKGQFLEGTLLFADISGFTNLSEKLKEMGGKAGAEEVTRIINEYLDVMLGILFKHNGLLIKFGGDAMLCLFTGKETGNGASSDNGAMDAVRTAWEMKQVMTERFGAIEVFQQIFPLSMKVGSNSGLLFAASVGTLEHMEYVLTGSAVERTAHAESAANRGDVLLSHETYGLVKGSLEAEPLEEQPGFYRVTNVHPAPSVKVEEQWSKIEKLLSTLENDLWGLVDRLDSLTPYLPTGVLPLLVYDPQHGQIEGQHRQVTILFANFIRMSEIIEARGVDDEAGIAADLSEYFQAVQEEVQYYGGVINKVDLYDQGDKLLAIFGAPVAHEQDAQRAALAALAMQEAMNRLSSPIISTLLSQRIGIHTGFVFAGNVGSSMCNRREYTVMGDTVNLTARLMSAAPPGQVWVSQRVWNQIQAGFEAQALPPVTVKGISDPVPVYQLQAASRVQKARDWSRVLRSDIVGRETELKALDEYFDDLLFGEGKQIIAIAGEAGVGKSRLIEEWQRRSGDGSEAAESAHQQIEGAAATWLSGRGHSYGQKAHGVFIEILEQLVAFTDDDAPGERWNKLSTRVKETFAGAEPGWFDEFSGRLAYLGQFLALDLSQKRGLTERVAQLEAETLQMQTRLAICDLLEHAAQESPLVLVLEDLHWADDASLDTLKFVVDRVSDASPLLFCLVYRPQKERLIWQVQQDIERSHPDCHSILLQELEAADGRQLLFNLLQTSQLPKDFQTLVLEETDGNPLYVEEVLHALIEEGVLVQDESGWQLTQSVEHIHVPDTLYQIIQSRIDELDFGSPGARRVLWMASVIGDEFTEELLLYLFTSTGRKKEEFLRHLRELRNAAMIERVRIRKGDRPQRGYRFRHGLVQQVAYENMLVAKRREHHCQVGQWLEEKYHEELQRHYDTLAYHHDQGEQWEKAAYYHRLAGERHKREYANREAAIHLRRTLEIDNQYVPLGGSTLLQVNEELGQVLAIMGQYDEALAHFTAALRLLGDDQQREAQLHRAGIYYHVGCVYERRGLLDEALDWQHRGLALLPQEPTVAGAQLHALGSAIGYHKPDHTLLKQEAEQTLSLAQQVNARAETAQAHNLLSIYYRNIGDLTQAAEHCYHAAAEYDQLADLIGMGRASLNLGVIAFEQDEWAKAKTAFRRAREGLERADESYLLAITYSNLGNLYCHLGDLDQAFTYARKGLDSFVAQNSHQGIVFAHAVLATVFWRQGKLEQARRELEQARTLIETHDLKGFEPTVGRWLAQVYLTDGDASQAEAEIQVLLSLDTDVLDVEVEPIQRLRGQSLAAKGNLVEAAQVLEDSLERLEQKQARYETARTLLALAGALAQMEGGVAEARTRAERARTIFADLGARLDVQEADELLTRL